MAFFLFVEGIIIAALIYVLILIVHVGISEISGKSKSETVGSVAIKGVIGNIAFYLFIFVSFIVTKSMGWFDTFFNHLNSSIG